MPLPLMLRMLKNFNRQSCVILLPITQSQEAALVPRPRVDLLVQVCRPILLSKLVLPIQLILLVWMIRLLIMCQLKSILELYSIGDIISPSIPPAMVNLALHQILPHSMVNITALKARQSLPL